MGASHLSGPLYVDGGIYAQGVPVLPSGSSGVPLTTGKYFFVSSLTGSNGNPGSGTGGTTPANPFATLTYALAQCTANNGDVIILMPGHAETISAAAGIAINKAGVTIVGLGNGNNRPLLTWQTLTSATVTITAADVTLRNIRTTSTITGLVTMFSVTGARCTFDGVDYFEDGTTAALQFILTTAAATDLTVQNCHWYRGTTAATALSQWIVLTGADRAKILNNFCILKGFATSNPINSIVAVVTTLCVGIRIERNRFYDSNSTGNQAILTIANTTGVIADNYIGTSKTATTFTWDSCFAFQNFVSNEVAKSGVLSPVADALG